MFWGPSLYWKGINLYRLRCRNQHNEDWKLKPVITLRCTNSYNSIVLRHRSQIRPQLSMASPKIGPQTTAIITIISIKLKLRPAANCEANGEAELSSHPSNRDGTVHLLTSCWGECWSFTAIHSGEDADSRTGWIFIRETAYFLCDSLNYESQFLE